MIKQTVKLAIFVAIVVHSSIGAVVTTKLYAALRKTQNIDPLLTKAEKGEMLTPQQKLQVRNTILSFEKTNPKIAEGYKNVIKKNEILSSLFPDIIGKEKIIKSDGSNLTSKDKQGVAKQAEQEVTNALVVYENSDKTTEDKKDLKTNIIATQDVVIKIDESNPINPLVTELLDKKLEGVSPEIVEILEDLKIQVNNQDVKDKQQDLIKNSGNKIVETYAKVPEVVGAEALNQELEIIIQAIKDSNASGRTGLSFKYTTEKRLEIYSEIFEKIAGFDKKFKTTNIEGNMKGTLKNKKIGVYQNFVSKLTRDINEELKNFSNRSRAVSYGFTLQYLSNRCDYLVEFTNNRSKKAEAEMGNWKQEYEKYVTPVITALLPIKNIFTNLEMINELFANSPEEKGDLMKDISVYIYGANERTGNFPQEITTDTISNLSNVSLAALLDRYLNYVETVYLGHIDQASDKVKDLFAGNNALLEIIFDDFNTMYGCFGKLLQNNEGVKNIFNELSAKYGAVQEKVYNNYK